MTAKKTTATPAARTKGSRPSTTTRAARAASPARAPRARSKAAAAVSPTAERAATEILRGADTVIPEMMAAVETMAASPVDESPAARRVTDDDIRVRAYFLALEHRGRGGSLDFWLQAERELRQGAAGD